MDLGDAQWLFAGKQGERWLVQAREGTAQAAAQLADEDLVAITRPDDTTFAFIGDGGTIYVSSSPLGAFGQMRRIEPAPMRIAAAGKSIVAIGWDGTVRRSVDAGKTFAPVAVGGHPFDALLSDDGRAMLLGFPERLWVSRDDAATWSEAPTPGLGLGMLGLDANGSLVARGVLRSLVWRPEQSPEVADRPWEQAPLGLLTDLQAGPSASALLDGRAVLAGDAYYEVARRDDEGPWYLAAGALTERLEWVPIAQSGACKQMTIGARGRHVVLGCMAGPRGGVLFPALRVMWSRDAGSTFTPPRPTSLVADEESVSLAILPDETLIVSGACQPGARGICSPAGPIRLVPARESRSLQFATVEPSELPAVVGRVGAVHVAHESDRLFATGLLASRRLAVLVSDDRGESFRAVPLDLSDTEVDEEHDVVELLSHMQPGKLTPDWDGTMSWVLHAATGPVWVVLDASGKVLSARFAPEGYPMLEAAGRRGIAFGAEDRFVMQSLDAGSSFSRLTRLPPAPGAAPMAWCGPGGCVFGDTFSRAGWQAEAGGIVDHERGQEDPEPEPPLRTPIVCDVIDGAAGELGDVVSFPSAGDAQRGPWAWSALVVDPKTAAVHVAHAVDMPKHAVSLSTLLRPVPNPDRIALDARPQAEGAAALRYTFRAAADGTPMVGSPMGRVEVAWENQFEGPARRASMVRPGALRAGDVSPRGKGLAAQANVGMLSVAPGGIHVCVHHSCDQPDDRITFFRNQGAVEQISIPPWPKRGLGGGALQISTHMMHVRGKHVPIALHQHRSVLMRADQQDDGSYRFPALGMGPWDADDLGLQEATYWAHLGSDLIGLLYTFYHPTRPLALSHVVRFDATDGVAKTVEVPTARDLSDPPPVCSDEQRRRTFRMPAPMMPGSRHPVIIDHGRMKEVLYTEYAVLYGEKGDGCAQVLDARSGESTHRRALIPVGSMERSWLLSRGKTNLQWYGMRCRFEPGATVEGEVSSPPPPASPTGVKPGMHVATDADCVEIFDRILTLMGGSLPRAAFGPAREAFKDTCRGKQVDMDCVRRAGDANVVMGTCLRL